MNGFLNNAIAFGAVVAVMVVPAESGDTTQKSGSSRIILNKQEFGALSAAVRHMEQVKRDYKGQQVWIEDKGESFFITFMDDPVDIRVAGDARASEWEVRKKDLKILRELLVR